MESKLSFKIMNILSQQLLLEFYYLSYKEIDGLKTTHE